MNCALCNLKIETPTILHENLSFCCHGCKAVFTILSSQNALENPRSNPIFIQALQAGIISNPLLLEEINAAKKIESDPQNVQRWHFEVGEMWCPTCAELIKWILMREKGVLHSVVDYSTDIASVEFDSMYVSKEKLTLAIQRLGYSVLPIDAGTLTKVPFGLYLRLAVAAFCSLNVMMLAYPLYATFFDSEEEGVGNLFAWISFYTSIPVLTYCAWPIFRKFWASLRVGLWGMEALVTTGTIAATALSLFELYTGSNRVYFDSMTVIVAFVLLGKVLEARAKFSAKEAFIKLTKSLPRKGRKKLSDDTYEFVPIKEIEVDDTLVTFAGEKIILDGVVLKGVGVCNESVMTGESTPVTKKKGDLLVSGTILSQGELHYKVIATAEKSLLSRIVEMTHAEIGKKLGYERPADAIVRWFIPLVILIAFMTGVGVFLFQIDDGQGVLNSAVLRMTAVLLISCPCAIGIAAPIAEGRLMSALAEEGVMIRNRGVLSVLGDETVYVFDKTGTVTEGKFEVLKGLEKLSEKELAILKNMTSHSNHLASRAVNHAIMQPPLKDVETVEIVSKGLIGSLALNTYYFGSRSFMEEREVILDSFSSPSSEMATCCYFARGKELLSIIHLGDIVREDIPNTLKELRGVKTVMLSGDHFSTVEAIALHCGFDMFKGEQSPDEKMAYIQEIIKKKETVAMVGDGINDAPALTAAHVGISVVSAADISIQVSDILLTTTQLSVLPKMRALGRMSKKIVKQNLFWAFFYNILGIALATLGALSPIYAAAAMVMSSLMVVLNAQRIRLK